MSLIEIKINSLSLKDKLNTLTSCMSPTQVLPVLDYVLCSIDKCKMTMTSSNLEVSVVTTVDVLSETNVKFLLNKDALAIIKKIKNEDFSLVIEKKQVTIKCSVGKYTTAFDNPEDFPLLPKTEDKKDVLELPFEMLQQGLKKCLPFSYDDSTLRPTICSIYIHKSNNLLKFVSFDGFVIASFNTGITISDDINIIFPKTAVKMLLSYSSKENTQLFLTKNNLIIIIDDITYYVRLIEGTYPDYKAILPIPVSIVSLSNKELSIALDNLSLMVNDSNNCLVVKVQGNKLYLKGSDKIFNRSGETVLNIKHIGIKDNVPEDKRFGVNLKKLQEICKTYSSDMLNIMFTSKGTTIITNTDNFLDPTILLILMRISEE